MATLTAEERAQIWRDELTPQDTVAHSASVIGTAVQAIEDHIPTALGGFRSAIATAIAPATMPNAMMNRLIKAALRRRLT